MRKKDKEILVQQTVNKLNSQDNFIFASFQGLKTVETNELRSQLRPFSWQCRVIKNTFYTRVFQRLGVELKEEFFQGPTLLFWGEQERKNSPDWVEIVRFLSAFTQTHPNCKLRGGYCSQRIFSGEEIVGFARLPSREVLVQQALSGIKFPLFRLVSVLRKPLTDLLYILNSKIQNSKH